MKNRKKYKNIFSNLRNIDCKKNNKSIRKNMYNIVN